MEEEIKVYKLNDLNKELLDDLIRLSISDLKELRKRHSKIQKAIKKETDYIEYSEPIDDLTKSVVKMNQDKSLQFHLLINEAIHKKYLQFFDRVKV